MGCIWIMCGTVQNFIRIYNCIFIRFSAILEAYTIVDAPFAGEFYLKLLGNEKAIQVQFMGFRGTNRAIVFADISYWQIYSFDRLL